MAKLNIEDLLRWRFKLADDEAQAEAPPLDLDRLFKAAKKWWQARPEEFNLALANLKFGFAHNPIVNQEPARVPMVILRDKRTTHVFVKVAAIGVSRRELSRLIPPETAIVKLS